MKWIHLKGSILILIIGICLFLPNHAYAYLDFGSGSLVFQFLVASLLGGLHGEIISEKNQELSFSTSKTG